MKAWSLALAMAVAVGGIVATGAVGTHGAMAQTTQQQRMKDCNQAAAAGGYKGDQRQSFMSQCLSGSGNAAASTAASPAAAKEKSCTADADAKKLAGAARTSFLKKCVGS